MAQLLKAIYCSGGHCGSILLNEAPDRRINIHVEEG